jgi:asparagine synthase (glutamine-hydrolysing)
MCGICGIVNFNGAPVNEQDLKRMMASMKHRGPDDEGIYIVDNMGLGFVRLSIIDLSSAGHQPMISANGRYVLVFNGEIFNYVELREELIGRGCSFNTRTDTEVLLNAFIEWGEACLDHFNGMWAFVIYDRDEKKIFAARDRYGIKPFYYLLTDDSFIFGSEIPVLLSLLSKRPKPDYQSIFDYLVFNRTDQTERTFFEKIKKLQHGHFIQLNLNPAHKSDKTGSDYNSLRFTIKKWYNLRERVLKTEGFKEANEFREFFSSAVGLRLRSDVPVGVCLSGGLDSSSIVSVLLRDYDKKDLKTFSAVYSKGQKGDETEFINEYESSLHNMYFTTPSADSLKEDLYRFIRAHAEPIPTTSPYAQFKVMESARGRVVVTLDGQGADEMLAGYHDFFSYYFKELFFSKRIFRLLSEICCYFKNHRSLFALQAFAFFLFPEKIRTDIRIVEKKYLNREFVKKYKATNSISGNIYGSSDLKDSLLNHFEYKLEHLLKWEDRNSMTFSLEARCPFLDYRLVEKTLATSSSLIIRKGTTKYILREAMTGILPDKIRSRKDKIGFGTPEDEWMRTEQWQNLITDLLKSPSFRERKLIDPEIALNHYQVHLSGKANLSKEIWKWIHLELWHREYID